jgi:outer membrane protein OmpA-like peptidoglycan-associated protein
VIRENVAAAAAKVAAAVNRRVRRRDTLMQRLSMVLLIVALASVSNGCIASRKFVRGEVKGSSDTLNARIEKTNGDVGEVRDGVAQVNGKVTAVDGRVTQVDGRVTQVDGRVMQLDAKTNERFDGVKNDVKAVDDKAASAQSGVAALDDKFQNRNLYAVASEKAILFRFDSAKLDSKFQSDLEEIASTLQQNPNALLVLEGRTDSNGDAEYNMKLGERRVDSVRRYLAVDKSVPVYRIHEISFGAAKPIAENKSREGREKNRAVVVTILVPKASATAAAKQNQN